MKTRKSFREGRETNPRFSMMEGGKDGSVLQEVERMYGKKVAVALRQYCELKDVAPYNVVNDTTEDRNGMCLWDKFDVWARNKKGLDIMADMVGDYNVDDELTKTSKKGHATTRFAEPSNYDIYGESGDQDEYDVLNFITDELNECEWVKWFDFDDYDATCTIGTSSGKAYDISVKENTTVQIDDED